jgi:hypothetical protein
VTTQSLPLEVILLLALIAYLLWQILATQRAQMKADQQFRDRQRFERLAADYFPTLWVNPDLRDEILSWLEASRSGKEHRLDEWNWYTLSDTAKQRKYQFSHEPSLEKFDQIIANSNAFISRSRQSKLTQLEADFLVYRAWRSLRFGIINNSFPREYEFEGAKKLLDESAKYLN